MSLPNPIEAFLQVAQMKARNRQQAQQDAQGIGQNLSDTAQAFQQQALKNKLAQAMQQPSALPVQGPQLPGAGMMGQGQPRPGQPGSIVPNPRANLMPILAQLYPEQFAKNQMMNPLQQSEIFRNYAAGSKAMGGGGGGRGTNKTDVWVDPASGRVSPTEKPGWTKRTVSDAEALQYTGVSKSADMKQDASRMKSLESDWKEVRKVVNPFRSTGIGGASSVFNKAAVANQSAARGLKILRKPSLTWQELNAYVNSDIASIQRGGGSPTDIQLHEANYHTLLGKVGAIKTFLTGAPSKGLVPPETRKQVEQNILDIINVDNQIIDDGIGYAESAYPEAIAAHRGTWENMKQNAMKIKTVGGGDSPQSGGGGSPRNDPLGIL